MSSSTASVEQQQQCYTILALYKFVTPKWESDSVVQNVKVELERFLRDHAVHGNILLGREGINGTICYQSSQQQQQQQGDNKDDNDPVYKYFGEKFPGIRLRLSYYDGKNVFHRLKIRLKNEIVTLGVHDDDDDDDVVVDPCQKVGTYVKPGPAWHELLEDPNTLVIDTRNEYEVQLGTFRNAVNPHTEAFTEFPAWFEKQIQQQQSTGNAKPPPQRIAMFCTGGIRCEKATSYCLQHRVVADANIPVYHLEGGILAYLDEVPEAESLWHGECFVFDQRTAVGHKLVPSTKYTLCHACRHPLDHNDRSSPDFEVGIACPYCVNEPDKESRRSRYQERQKQCEISEKTNVPHLHDAKQAKMTTVSQTS